MSVNVISLESHEAGQVYFGPIHKVYVDRLAENPYRLSGYDIPLEIWKQYDGIAGRIVGHYDSPNEKTFDAIQKTLESVPGVAVHRIVFPRGNPDLRERPRYDTHYLIIVGDIEKGFEALLREERPRIMPLILEDAIELAQQYRQPPARTAATDAALRRGAPAPEASA